MGNVSGTLYTAFCALGFLLLIAFANVANLLLGRAILRQREMAIRSPFGVSWARLAAQLFVESLILAAR